MEPRWIPVVPSEELSSGDLRAVEVAGFPMRVVVFRTQAGEAAAFLEACPHVGRAKATFARGWTDGDGIRCKFHGWKYDVHGMCVDVPDAPKGTDVSRYPRASTFPTREAGGSIWIQVAGAASGTPSA